MAMECITRRRALAAMAGAAGALALGCAGCGGAGASPGASATSEAEPAGDGGAPGGTIAAGQWAPAANAWPRLSWRGRPAGFARAKWRFDPAGMPAPTGLLPSEMYFSTASARLNPWARVEFGRQGQSDGGSFEFASFDQLPDAERAAIDADAAACQEQLAAYLWRKYGMTIAEGELQVRTLRPVVNPGEGHDGMREGYHNAPDATYTGYFYAELEHCNGGYWYQSARVVFSPVGSAEHLEYGGMDDIQWRAVGDALCADVGPLFPKYAHGRYDHGGSYAVQEGAPDVGVSIMSFPALGDFHMVGGYLEDGGDWRGLVRPGSQVSVDAVYIEGRDEAGFDLARVAAFFDGPAFGGVAAMAQVQSGARFSDWGLYSGGEWDQWANALWLQTHERAEQT